MSNSLTTFLSFFTALLLIVVIFRIVGFDKLWRILAGPADKGPVDFATLRKSRKPNQFLLAPENYCKNETPDKTSPTYSLSAEELKQKLLASLENEQNLERVDDGSSALSVRLVQRSKKLRFPDTIPVEIIPLDGSKSTIVFYSQSQIGYRDFGVNRARIMRWLRRLEEFEAD